MKKAQLSAMIFMAVLILFIIMFVLFIYAHLNSKDTKNSTQELVDRQKFSSEIDFIQSCMEQSAIDSLTIIGNNGGFAKPALTVFDDDSSPLTIHKFRQTNFAPTVDVVQEELSIVFLKHFKTCLDANEYRFQYTTGSAETVISIYDVSFELDFPILIQKGTEVHSQAEFHHIERDIRLNTLIHVSQEIAKESQLCLSCTHELADEYDVAIHMQDISPIHIVYYVSDLYTAKYDEPYIYRFAHDVSVN